MTVEAEPQITSHTYRVGDLDLCTFEQGQGPLLILAHGITANARVWDPIAAALSRRWRVVALDQRGHGRSGRPADGRYDAEAFAGDLAGLVEALGATRAVIVGHSLGGRNALATAALHPEAVSAVVSVEYTPAAGALDFRLVAERLRLAALPMQDGEAVMANLRERYPLLPPEALLRRRDYGYRQMENGSWVPLADSDGLEATLESLAGDTGRFLDDIVCPTLMLTGTLPGAITDTAIAQTQRQRPDFPLIRIADTDHFVHEERPDDVALLIERWLERVLPAAY